MSNLPVYLQIAEQIENDILNGYLKPDEQVPSTNEFSKMLKVNPATAGKGLSALVDEGILYKKRGIGMFVLPDAEERIRTKRRETFIQKTLPQFIKEVKRLQFNHDELLKRIRSELDVNN
ncbi:GntR family transcriptional regulator [Atopobacter phocae]|uniref:GntR family transcriptional regulator n=1 Tax=Atopobacter phocae TaxID=136492 RepID=UPI00046F3037|nr:GntR family transcriptional regulator [Atopobacter phocae]